MIALRYVDRLERRDGEWRIAERKCAFDWTRHDPRITETLSALGRNAIPVYAFYLPGEDHPRLLPEVLTPKLVLDEISRLPAARSATALSRAEPLRTAP